MLLHASPWTHRFTNLDDFSHSIHCRCETQLPCQAQTAHEFSGQLVPLLRLEENTSRLIHAMGFSFNPWHPRNRGYESMHDQQTLTSNTLHKCGRNSSRFTLTSPIIQSPFSLSHINDRLNLRTEWLLLWGSWWRGWSPMNVWLNQIHPQWQCPILSKVYDSQSLAKWSESFWMALNDLRKCWKGLGSANDTIRVQFILSFLDCRLHQIYRTPIIFVMPDRYECVGEGRVAGRQGGSVGSSTACLWLHQ